MRDVMINRFGHASIDIKIATNCIGTVLMFCGLLHMQGCFPNRINGLKIGCKNSMYPVRCSTRSNKNIERHIAHTNVSRTNLQQWKIGHTSDLMMTIRQSICIHTIIIRDMSKLNTHISIYFMKDNWEIWHNLRHTLDWMYLKNYYNSSKLLWSQIFCLNPQQLSRCALNYFIELKSVIQKHCQIMLLYIYISKMK